MGMKRVMVQDAGIVRPARAGDGALEHNEIITNASAGNQTITIPQVLAGVALFTGAAGAVAYTTPTAADIIAALPELDIGDTYTFRLCNTAAQTATITAGTGVTLAGFTTVNAATRTCIVRKTAATTVTITSI
jgi:hypothetical protein